MIMTLLSAAIFAYSINTKGSIFKDLEKIEANFKKNQFIILNYMRFRNISKNIKMNENHQIFRIYLQKKTEDSIIGE